MWPICALKGSRLRSTRLIHTQSKFTFATIAPVVVHSIALPNHSSVQHLHAYTTRTDLGTRMSSYYSSPPSSPMSGFFPTGPSSPHAFSSFHQSPRDTHAMYAAFGSPYTAGQNTQESGNGSKGAMSSLKRLVKRK